MNKTATKRTISEWAEFLADRYDGTPFDTTNQECWAWCAAGIDASEEDEKGVAAAWEETRVDDVLESFNANDWEAIGKRDAGSLSNQELAETGYENPTANGTPWSDGEPEEAKELWAFDSDSCASVSAEEKIKDAIRGAIDAYNSGYIAAVTDAIGEMDSERTAQLARADAAGWRICRFGLPGASVHLVRVAGPGTADAVSAEIFSPGPCGPYDSTIMTPSEADACNWRDGNPIYRDEVDSILSQLE